AQDIIGTVDISTDDTSVFSTIQSVSPSNALPTKDMLLFIVRVVHWYLVKIEKTRLASIGLLCDLNVNSNQFRFIRNHVNKAGMWDHDEVLIVLSPHAHLLLPKWVLPNNDRAHALFDQKVNDAPTGGVQVVIHLPVALVGDAFHLCRYTVSILFGKLHL